MTVPLFRICLLGLVAGLISQEGFGADSPSTSRPGSRITLPSDATALHLGDAAPDFRLPGVDGKEHALADYAKAEVLMVIFLSNHCPYSHAIEGRLEALLVKHREDGLVVVAISPNHPEAVRIDELGYSRYNDSFAEMKAYATERKFTFPYLYDGDSQTTAKAYGCRATPHVFIFDRERRLRYAGRFDDSRYPDPATVQSPDAGNAVAALLGGNSVPVGETRPVGCSTKWFEKRAEVRSVDTRLASRSVALESVDAAAVEALIANNSNRLRVINVWATWCAPCVSEFPGLVELSHWLTNRDFELITISIDDPEQEPRVRGFLEKHRVVPSNRLARLLKKEGRGATNYLYSGRQVDDLIEALDPSWPGPVPYTVVVTPAGEIVFRHAGELEFGHLKKVILEELGSYYTSGRR